MDVTLILTSKGESLMLGSEEDTKQIYSIQVLEEEAGWISYAAY